MSAAFPYQELGRPGGEPLVLLHGSFGARADWLPLAQAFADSCHCLLPDLPGHGANITRDVHDVLTMERLSEELADFLGATARAPAVLVGYGLGGRLALHTALAHPAAAMALVLESVDPGLRDDHERRKRQKRDRELAAALRRCGLAEFLDSWYALPVFESLQARPQLLAKYKQERRKAAEPEWAAKILEELGPGAQVPLWERLGELAVPALFISGELDPKYCGIMKEAAALCPRGRHCPIREAGHLAHVEQFESVAQEVRAFLALL